jgi:hypothetical protein
MNFQQTLQVPYYLDLEVKVSATIWSNLQQGSIMTCHCISWDLDDGDAMQASSNIALGVLLDNVTVEQAFQLVNDTAEKESQFHGLGKRHIPKEASGSFHSWPPSPEQLSLFSFLYRITFVIDRTSHHDGSGAICLGRFEFLHPGIWRRP